MQDRLYPKKEHLENAVKATNILNDYANRVVPQLRELVSKAKFKVDGHMFEKDHNKAQEILKQNKPQDPEAFSLRAFIDYQFTNTIYVELDISHMTGETTCRYIKQDHSIGDRKNSPPEPWEEIPYLTWVEAIENVEQYEQAIKATEAAISNENRLKWKVFCFWQQ